MHTYAILLELADEQACKNFASLIGVANILESLGGILACNGSVKQIHGMSTRCKTH